MAFAVPIALARPLVAGVDEVVPLDRSTVDRAVPSCLRALERAAASYPDCQGFAREHQVLTGAMDELERSSGSGGHRSQRVSFTRPTLEGYEALERARMLAQLRASDFATEFARILVDQGYSEAPGTFDVAFGDPVAFVDAGTSKPTEPPDAGTREEQIDRIRSWRVLGHRAVRKPHWDARILERSGLKVDASTWRRGLQEVLKMGFRVEKISPVGPGQAWALIVGRNLDGSGFRMSTFWVRTESGWREEDLPVDSELTLRPSAWPPPLHSFAEHRRELAADLRELIRKFGSSLDKDSRSGSKSRLSDRRRRQSGR
jgi:hypothetical protein